LAVLLGQDWNWAAERLRKQRKPEFARIFPVKFAEFDAQVDQQCTRVSCCSDFNPLKRN
jgi:hypothetical protein